MRAYERFLGYVKINTMSCEESDSVPSTAHQFDLAHMLVKELEALGIGAECDEKCYVYAHIDATKGLEGLPAVGFISHIDTIPDFSGENVCPRVIPDYDGKDVDLGHGRVLSPTDFPHLAGLAGRTLITTSGDTVLGADDKAGVAEIMTFAERLVKGNIPHGKICIGFTPDEEIGRGADCFDVKRFGAAFAYTVDGGPEGEIDYENFNAASAEFSVTGFNIHPGSAKDKMINAALVAFEINSMLPSGETPRDTEGYEGFFHLCSMKGDCSAATLDYIVRDHSAGSFDARLATLRHIEKLMNEKYGAGTVLLTIREQYRNMKEKIEDCMYVVDIACDATRAEGLEPLIIPVRGGTDGARLSFMGLPCPNLGTGGYACHGPFEHITAEGMDKVVDILVSIVGQITDGKVSKK